MSDDDILFCVEQPGGLHFQSKGDLDLRVGTVGQRAHQNRLSRQQATNINISLASSTQTALCKRYTFMKNLKNILKMLYTIHQESLHN